MAALDQLVYLAMNRAVRLVGAGAGAVFLLLTIYFIVRHHVVPLSRDQWHMYHALLEQGVWQTSVTTVSGHRHVLAFMLYAIDLHAFSGNNHFLVGVDWALNLLLVAILLQAVRQLPASAVDRGLFGGWVVLWLCWLLNIALLGWGFNGINNYLSIVNTVLAVLCLYRAVHGPGGALAAVAALFFAALATFSFGNGVLVWPIALLLLLAWRAPGAWWLAVLLAAVLGVAAYCGLPGGEVVGQSLRFNGWQHLAFPVQVMGAPVYHLLRAWQCLPLPALDALGTLIGLLLTAVALVTAWQAVLARAPLDRVCSLALALVAIGYGTCLMLTMTRVEGVLDPAVDRFQVWALLVWVGLALWWYPATQPSRQRYWHAAFLLFPLLALPSQLDWGARLAEYRQRVEQSLLSYQVYLPVAEDAEKALHWNWENKVPHLFAVMELLREHRWNVFSASPAVGMGEYPGSLDGLPVCAVNVLAAADIRAGDLLPAAQVPAGSRYRVEAAQPSDRVGKRWRLAVSGQDWEAGWLLDASGQLQGLARPVRPNALPRASAWLRGIAREESGNAVAVIRWPAPEPADPAVWLVLLHQGQPVCRSGL